MKIALTGKMRSGKDTVAKYFIDSNDLYQMAFGDGIKRVAREYFPEIVAKGKPRKLYQFIGQKFREMDENVWINELNNTMYTVQMKRNIKDFIVTDVRQMNEYHYLKMQGFTVIKVEANDEIRKERIIQAGDVFEPEDFYHETETTVDLIPYDYLITNNDTYEALIDQLIYIHNELMEEGK